MSVQYGKTIDLSVPQLLLLLFKREIEGLPFFDAINNAQADGKALKLAMVQMIEDKILVPGEDEKFYLCDQMQAVMDILAEAERACFIRWKESGPVSGCLYCSGGEAAFLRMDELYPDRVRMEIMKVEQAYELTADLPFLSPSSEDETVPVTSFSMTSDAWFLMHGGNVRMVSDLYLRGERDWSTRICIAEESRIKNMSGLEETADRGEDSPDLTAADHTRIYFKTRPAGEPDDVEIVLEDSTFHSEAYSRELFMKVLEGETL